jgi:glucuronoarabinoxylan endo-1,4-beta-xylanase
MYGTALSATQLDASSGGVAGTFAYSPAVGTVLTVGSQKLSVTFTPTDTTDYTDATASVMLTVTQATPTITWATPAAIVAGATLGSAQLDATADVAGSFSYSPASGTVLNTLGSTTLSTTFTPTDMTDYTTATDKVSLMVIPAAGTALADFGAAEQTIRGFGGSTAWMPELTSGQANALFGDGSGQIGLSILRVRIDPSSTTGGANWATELGNAQEAQALGAIVIATPWTPPAAWKSSNSGTPYNGSNPLDGGFLDPTYYADYANYLESYVTYMANGGVNLYGISMQNEPEENVSYESCVWTPAQMDTWVAQNASVLTTKLIMPESATFSTAYSDPALDDANAVGYIGIVAGHLYGTSPFYYTNAENKGKDVWMTEHYLSPAGAQPAIADALAAAEEIHNSLTVGQYNAYVWWWALDWNPGSGVTNTGLVDTNNNPTYYGYAMAQFASFVKTGYVRVNATATPVAGVYLSAYSGSGHSVIVVINTNSSTTSLPIYIANQTVTSLTPYQTTSTGGMVALSAVSVSSDNFTASLPAQSITTFVQ